MTHKEALTQAQIAEEIEIIKQQLSLWRFELKTSKLPSQRIKAQKFIRRLEKKLQEVQS